MEGASDVVAGNLIGLNATGTAPLDPGTSIGVNIGGTGNIIGGLSPNDRNVITGAGYIISEYGGGGTQVLNNYIGSDITGTIGLEHIGQNNGTGYADINIEAVGSITIGLPGAGNLIVDSWPFPFNDSFGIGVSEASGPVIIQGTRSARTPREPLRSPTVAASTLRVPTAS